MKLKDLKEISFYTNVGITLRTIDSDIIYESSGYTGADLESIPKKYLDYKVLSLDIDDGAVEIIVRGE